MPAPRSEPPIQYPASSGFGSFKAHKSLPRHRDYGLESNSLTPTSAMPGPMPATFDEQAYSSDMLRVPEVPRSKGKEVKMSPVIGAPLTPPPNGKDDFKSWIDDSVLQNRTYPPPINGQLSTSSLRQTSPPTPETTPPRGRFTNKRGTSESVSANATKSLRSSSSFQTAQEDFLSDDEHPSESTLLPPAHYQNIIEDKSHYIPKAVGLGLGLEPEADEATPRQTTPKPQTDSEYVTFDGAWGGETPNRIHGHLQDRFSKVATDETPLIHEESSPPSNRGMYADIQQWGEQVSPTIEATQQLRRQSVPQRKQENLRQPLAESLEQVEAEYEALKNKRASHSSTDSTVITARIVDNTPQRRNTLRHTGKIVSPNEQEHIVGRGPSLRRTANERGTDLRKSYSVASQRPSSKSWGSNTHLVVIPDRRSMAWADGDSLNSRVDALRSSHRERLRPTTAPEKSAFHTQSQPQHRRTQSVIIQQKPVEAANNAARDAVPSMFSWDTLSSSFPAPQSSQDVPSATTDLVSQPASAYRDVSNTTVGHPGSLKTHRIPNNLDTQTLAPAINVASPSSPSASLAPSISGHPRSTSSLLSPFSISTLSSGTPGIIEISEATALNIYPHTNKSILVIPELADEGRQRRREQQSWVATNATFSIPGTFGLVNGVAKDAAAARERIYSPLQNPRSAPQPPETAAYNDGEATYGGIAKGSRLGRMASLKRSLTLPIRKGSLRRWGEKK